MMFAQANSEHCRHKIFNANWDIDGEPQRPLAVRHDQATPTRCTRDGILVRLQGQRRRARRRRARGRFYADPDTREYAARSTRTDRTS